VSLKTISTGRKSNYALFIDFIFCHFGLLR
jgi:hypothetical protein